MRIRKKLGYALIIAGMAFGGSNLSAEVEMIALEKPTGVEVVGGGTLNLNALSFDRTGTPNPAFRPEVGTAFMGTRTGGGNLVDVFTGLLGPTHFGDGTVTFASLTDGDFFGVRGTGGFLVVDSSYISGEPLSSGVSYPGATFGSLGLEPGTYVWTWGVGADADAFTLQIGPGASSGGHHLVASAVETIAGVEVTTEGSVNLTALDFDRATTAHPAFRPIVGTAFVSGRTGGEGVYVYTGMRGPESIGNGETVLASEATGSFFGVRGTGGSLVIDRDYISGDQVLGYSHYEGLS